MDSTGSWYALPEELQRHALSFVWPYTRSYARARLVCVDWSKFIKKLPKRPPPVADPLDVHFITTNCGPLGLPQSAFSGCSYSRIPISERSIGQLVYYDEIKPEPVQDDNETRIEYLKRITSAPKPFPSALPPWPERLPRLSARRRAQREQMFADFGFDLMAALEEATLDAPARAATSRPLIGNDVR